VFLQALAEYADAHLAPQLCDIAFEPKRVSYLIELGEDGLFLGVTDCQPASQNLQGRAPVLPAPRSPRHRTGGICPLLVCDNLEYVLGPGDKHVAFVRLIEDAEADASDRALRACLRFYGNRNQVDTARGRLAAANPPPGAVIALSQDGPVILRETVRSFWRGHYARHFDTRLDPERSAMCLVSGQVGPVLDIHEKIKSLTAIGGTPAGAALVSFGAKAFNSYGWRQGANSPVSAGRAAAYTIGLNSLLKGGSASRVDHGETAFLHWTNRLCVHSPVGLLEKPDGAKIAALTGAAAQLPHNLQGNQLHVIGISANSGRLIVRCSMAEDLDRVLRNLWDWFEDLAIADPFTGGLAEPRGMAVLLSALARGGQAPPDMTVRLFRRALVGEPLGNAELAAVLRCRRAAAGAAKLSPAHAGLIRMCVNDRLSGSGTLEEKLPAELDPSLHHPAYLVGRLLALYDVLEYHARRRSGSSVSDRYYRLISPSAGAALPRLFELGAKFRQQVGLRHPNQNSAVIERIEEIERRLGDVGCGALSVLGLEDQGRLAVGFHHQSAANTARAALRNRERPDKKKGRQAAHA
jgi:CRISPR-associated protein Csd1